MKRSPTADVRTHPGERDRDAALLLELVRALVAEVHPHRARMAITLERRFDDELGLASLELVELLLRVEDAFGVALPSHVLSTCETPADLLRAINEKGREPVRVREVRARASSEAVEPPVAASTLVEVLEWHARTSPDRTHLRLLTEDGVADELTYGELLRRSEQVAAGLGSAELGPGDRVAMMLPTGIDYFVTFAGVLLAGGVPVPIYPPARPSQLADHLRRHAHILANAGATWLVTVPEAIPLGRSLRGHVDTLIHVVVPDALVSTAAAVHPRPTADDVAFLQYTSGSTGHPKGVVLTHANLLANIRAMGAAAGVSSADTFVSWLPLYHDMGLIGAWLASLYFGMLLAVMPPQVFLTRPVRWLRAIHEHHGTISAGPNFAYELCINRIADAELEGLDLRSWRLAFNGAEPVSPATLERFASRFEPYGFRRTALAPVYGLAESSVGLAFPPLGRPPRIDRIDRERFLHTGRAAPASADEPASLDVVGCGRPLPGHEIRVVDAAGEELADRDEGKVEFRGPSATSGYFRNPDATRALFHGDWLGTGDLGYMADGEIFVTGRVKDVIIRAGRNLHPDELEHVVGDLPGVRRGCVAVFASTDPVTLTERLVVMAETRETDEEVKANIRQAIVASTVDCVGVPPDDVVLAPPRTVLKTSSGKIRRVASRERYEHGMSGEKPQAVWRQLARFGWSGLRPRMRRARRAVGAVVHAVLVWVVAFCVVVPLLVLLAVVPGRERRARLARAAIATLSRATRTAVTAHGLDRLPDTPCVVVANHASWLDALALVLVLPPSYRFVAGEIFTQRRISGYVLRRLGVELVDRVERERGVEGTDVLVEMARAGSLVIFPEGRLARFAGLRPFHMGAFVVAARAGVPVVPVAILGTRSILRPGHRFPRRGAAHVIVAEPIEPAGSDWAAAVALQQAARAAVLRHCGEPDLD